MTREAPGRHVPCRRLRASSLAQWSCGLRAAAGRCRKHCRAGPLLSTRRRLRRVRPPGAGGTGYMERGCTRTLRRCPRLGGRLLPTATGTSLMLPTVLRSSGRTSPSWVALRLGRAAAQAPAAERKVDEAALGAGPISWPLRVTAPAAIGPIAIATAATRACIPCCSTSPPSSFAAAAPAPQNLQELRAQRPILLIAASSVPAPHRRRAAARRSLSRVVATQ